MFLDSRILNVLCLAVLVGLALANVSTAQHKVADNEARYEAIMEEKKLLLLTEINELDYNSKETQLPDFDNVMGVGDYLFLSCVIISDNPPIGQERLIMEVVCPDLTSFYLGLAKPKSFSIAKEFILDTLGEITISAPIPIETIISKFCHPKLEGDNYTLFIDGGERYIGLTRLSIGRGVLVESKYRSRWHPSPLNREVLIAQMENLIDELIVFIDGGGDVAVTDERRAYYQALKLRYNEALNRPRVKSVPDDVPKYELLLTAIPDPDQDDKGAALEKNRTDKVTARRPYLVSRADGKSIPLVKIANPEKVSTDTAKSEIFKSHADGIHDIQFQIEAQGNPHYGIRATLRSDGHYQVSLVRSGKQTLRVFSINKNGEVVEYGEIEVEVVE